MTRLKDKIAVITGASSGIGRGIAEAFAREGADVVVNYLKSKDSAESLVEEIKQSGRRAIAVQADMANEDDIDRLIEKTIEEFGRIDIWVNNAGADILTGTGAAAEIHEKLEHLIEVDLRGTINACWSITQTMQEQGYGVIVNMGWDLATHGFEGTNPQIFAATKAGVLGFTRSFAKSVGPEIRVNLVSPGWISTAFAEDHMDAEYRQARISEIPLARFGRPEDVAAAVVFLASDDSSYLTGEAIKINGGLV
ncbi:MAG TPA: glucose 1-dehydrogenase [Thiotrichaceae bacterium]|jgi:3-oxoacyl-[acyl-carrier protein] reductase|nr:glucose 1-dehydrogenase [Thiotrichaceae bacterium]HIM08759.1 glucose 1-dehydrogenase [Gammaproteobacteria bacterium]